MNQIILDKMTGRIEMMKRDVADIQRIHRLAGFENEIENPNILLVLKRMRLATMSYCCYRKLKTLEKK